MTLPMSMGYLLFIIQYNTPRFYQEFPYFPW